MLRTKSRSRAVDRVQLQSSRSPPPYSVSLISAELGCKDPQTKQRHNETENDQRPLIVLNCIALAREILTIVGGFLPNSNQNKTQTKKAHKQAEHDQCPLILFNSIVLALETLTMIRAFLTNSKPKTLKPKNDTPKPNTIIGG